MKARAARKHLPALILALAVVLGALYAIVHEGLLSGGRLGAYADEVIRTCAGDEYPPACYDTEIPKLMDRGLTMEQAFDVVSLVTERVKDQKYNYFFCHVVAHNLSAKETAKDPSAWASVLARCPAGMCSNGCLHGAAQERFRGDVLPASELTAALPELTAACSPADGTEFTSLQHAACRHALGHLAMYVTGASIPAALSVCDAVTDGEALHFRRTCYEGVFMQMYQPLDAEDTALVKDIAPATAAEAKTFCASFMGAALSACNTESWPLYGPHALEEPDTLAAFCGLTPDPVWIRRCYNDLFAVFTSNFQFDHARIVPECERFSGELEAQCFANAASYSLETDYRLAPQAAKLCAVAESAGAGERCYEELLFYSAYNYRAGSPEFTAMCKALPEPWRTRCLSGDGQQILSGIIDSIP